MSLFDTMMKEFGQETAAAPGANDKAIAKFTAQKKAKVAAWKKASKAADKIAKQIETLDRKIGDLHSKPKKKKKK